MSKDKHMKMHTELLVYTLHSEECKQKARAAHKRPEYKDKIRQIMSSPEMKIMLSERAKQQWENEEYKNYMIKKLLDFYRKNDDYRTESLKRLSAVQKEYWSKEENRQMQSERVTRYFKVNQDAKSRLAAKAKLQWQD